jgi:DNA polymerase
MPIVHWDFETRSVALLKQAGAWRYAADPSTEVLCVGYAIDDGEPQLWVPGDPVPSKEFETADQIVAHNYAFERAIATRILEPKYGWPCVPLEKQRCSMSMALACALPGELNAAAVALGLPLRKDRDGYRLMQLMSRPRRPHKGEDPHGIYWIDDVEKRARLHAYCMRDVEVERALYVGLPLLSPTEQAFWQLDATIDRRGFYVDLTLAKATQRIVRQEQAAINAELARHTGGEITSAHQVARIVAFIRRQGLTLAALTKGSVAALLAHGPDDIVRHVLELRQRGARASVRKLDRLLTSVGADGRMRSTLRFHGSATGRWSGRGYQPQNLKKAETKDIDGAVDAVLAGDMARICELGAPLTIAGDVSRAMICAAPDHSLVCGDFSAIESRVLSWLAREEWKVANYREYDASVDKGQPRPDLEPYCATASRMLKRTVKPEDEGGRAIGKGADLALGYGGALGAWRRINPADDRADGEVLQNIKEWRLAHPAIVRFWKTFERGCLRAIATGQNIELGSRFAFAFEDGTFFVTLPSGRRLAYPKARIGPGKYEGTRQIYFHDNACGGWTETRAWYGILVENAVQAVARDLLAAAMQRLERAGYQVVLHVHDEIVCEVPEPFNSTNEFLCLLTELPGWAEGLPLAAKVWTGKRYAKSKPQPEAESESVKLLQDPPATETQRRDALSFVEAQNSAASIAPSKSHPDAENTLDAEVDDNIAEIPLVDLIGEPLVNGKILCPFHEDHTPSLQIYADHFHCFACEAHGSHLDWLMQIERLSYEDALHTLKTWDSTRTRAIAHDDKAPSRVFALQLWEEAGTIAGSLAAHYLAGNRGIDLAALPTDIHGALRFHARCPFGSGTYHPCLLALMRDPRSDAATGIHRIALTPEGKKIERRTLGQTGAVKLWPPGAQLIIGEGLETVLAAATRIPYCDAPLQLLSAGPLDRFPVIAGVERLIILVDHDVAGQTAALGCTARWQYADRTVVQLTPDEPGADFNDFVMPD